MVYTVVYFCIPNVLLAGHAPESGHLYLTPPVAAYENHSRKRPAPVKDILFASRGCLLTRASAVYRLFVQQFRACTRVSIREMTCQLAQFKLPVLRKNRTERLSPPSWEGVWVVEWRYSPV